MQADLSHFIIEDKQNLGWRFHWLRAEQQEPIDIWPKNSMFPLT